MGAEFDPARHLLIKACEQVEKLLHSKRQEGLAYVAPFVTASEVKESIESYWSRSEASQEKREKAGNPPLELKETFKKFINSSGSSTLLLLGEAGLGKTLTTYLWGDQLLSEWWSHINKGAKAPQVFPLFIRPSLSTWSHDSIEGAFLKVMKEYNLPSNIPLLVFIDGYDELSPSAKGAQVENLVKQLGLQGYPQVKLIVTCRPNTVEVIELQSRFSFNSQLETRYFLPFKLDQLLNYLKTELSWNDALYEEYKQRLEEAENVRTVLRNPFVLHLVKESWETVSKKSFHELSRYQIYEGFIEHTLKTQQSLISQELQKRLQGSFPNLLTSYQAFASAVAWDAFQKNNITLGWKEAEELATWANLKEYAEMEAKKAFNERQELLKAELAKAVGEEKIKLTRRSLLKEEDYVRMTLKRVGQFEAELPMKLRGGEGDKRYEYSHKSLFEYFMAKGIILLKNIQNSELIIEEGIKLLSGRPIQEEKEVLNFFEEGWGREEVNLLKEPLFEIIKASRRDTRKTQSSANAATLLAAAHVPFSGRDLSAVKIKGANLSNAVFDQTCFYKADLQNVILHRVWLDKTDLREANLLGVDFGELPSLKLAGTFCTPYCVSYSRDGMHMALGKPLGEISLYKKEERGYKQVKQLTGHASFTLAYSPDGKQLAATGETTIRIWDTETLQVVTQLEGHSRNVRYVTYSPDGMQLASVGYDKIIWIWDTATSQPITQLEGHSDWVTHFTYSPDGSQLASGSMDKTVVIWDTATFQPITQLKKQFSDISVVTYSPDGSQLASGSIDNTVVIWDTTTFQPITQLKWHSSAVTSVTYSPDGSQLASGSMDKTVVIGDVNTFQAIIQLKGHTGFVYSVTYSPDGKQLTSVGQHEQVARLWDTATFKPITQLKGHAGPVKSITYSPDGKQLASGGGNVNEGELWIWDTETLKPVAKLKGHSDLVNNVTYSPDGKQLASSTTEGGGGEKSEVRLWSTETFQGMAELGWDSCSALSVTYSPDGKQLAAGGGGTVKIWEVKTLQMITQLKGEEGRITTLTYSPDGKQLAGAGTNWHVRLWDSPTLQNIKELIGHLEEIKSLAYSPDGKTLASGGKIRDVRGGEGLRLWSTQTLKSLTASKERSNSLAYSPDGKQLASGVGGGICIKDAQTLQAVSRLKGHLDEVNSITYSPDGKQLASASEDNAIFLWAKQGSSCLPGEQESWQLMRRFERSSRLFAEDAFLKGAKISESNLELLKQKGANDDQDLPGHSHFSLVEEAAISKT